VCSIWLITVTFITSSRWGRALGCCHLHQAVDLAALLHHQRLGRNVPVHRGPGLHLDALGGRDPALDAPPITASTVWISPTTPTSHQYLSLGDVLTTVPDLTTPEEPAHPRDASGSDDGERRVAGGCGRDWWPCQEPLERRHVTRAPRRSRSGDGDSGSHGRAGELRTRPVATVSPPRPGAGTRPVQDWCRRDDPGSRTGRTRILAQLGDDPAPGGRNGRPDRNRDVETGVRLSRGPGRPGPVMIPLVQGQWNGGTGPRTGAASGADTTIETRRGPGHEWRLERRDDPPSHHLADLLISLLGLVEATREVPPITLGLSRRYGRANLDRRRRAHDQRTAPRPR
jgi:hypothetical protein